MIGGVVSAPIVVILAISGLIYLFKEGYEAPERRQLMQVDQTWRPKMSYQQQWELVQEKWSRNTTAMAIPQGTDEATEFSSGIFSDKSLLFLDPYSKRINGTINISESDMNRVRKLHGELLLGGFGTKLVELVACWMVVLIITGLFLFWPRARGWRAIFMLRIRQSKRIFFRDLHSLLGFWFSLLLLLVLAGALPWTDVFGANFKWLQQKTNTGYPATWSGKSLASTPRASTITLDEVVLKAQALNLAGRTFIDLPQKPTNVFSIYNETNQLAEIRRVHVDSYSGEILISHSWEDIGIMMKGRLWVMAFHQGEFGLWNWYLMIFVATGLLILSLSAIIAYTYRKQPAKLSFASSLQSFAPSGGLVLIIIGLGVLFPLFGLNVLLIYAIGKIVSMRNHLANE